MRDGQAIPRQLLDRAQGAFLGLGLGDAYGRPLEFTGLPQVRTQPVSLAPGSFRWTDDTHMALYLGKAVLDLPAGPLDSEQFGHAVGRRFVEWLHDPIQPSTAPGRACEAGARAYQESGSWRESGNPHSDGCGAVMRICPLALAWSGDDLTHAARISAVVTHAHPNAVEASIAASHLTRWALDAGSFSEPQVVRAIQQLEGPWDQGGGGQVASGLRAALLFARQARKDPDLHWLPEADIPTGDGGWRSASALGLAVAAALAWGDDFGLAVERAARIAGDSDSVAALTGMLLGAAGGTGVLPVRWLHALPERDEIAELAKLLLTRWSIPPGEGLLRGLRPGFDDESRRTSTSNPLEVVWLDTPLPGRIGLTLTPGMKAPSALGAPWDRDLDQDLGRLVAVWRADLLVTLLEQDELTRLGVPDLVSEAEARGVVVLRHPIPQGGAGLFDDTRAAVDIAIAFARSGRNAVFHCRTGIGRSGMVAACCLVRMGAPAEIALEKIRRVLGHRAAEAPSQEAFVTAFEAAL